MAVHLSETANEAVAVGQGRSGALECCSEQRTPAGLTTLTPLWPLCEGATKKERQRRIYSRYLLTNNK